MSRQDRNRRIGECIAERYDDKIQSAASKLEYTSRNLMIVDFCELTDSEWIVVALVLF